MVWKQRVLGDIILGDKKGTLGKDRETDKPYNGAQLSWSPLEATEARPSQDPGRDLCDGAQNCPPRDGRGTVAPRPSFPTGHTLSAGWLMHSPAGHATLSAWQGPTASPHPGV